MKKVYLQKIAVCHVRPRPLQKGNLEKIKDEKIEVASLRELQKGRLQKITEVALRELSNGTPPKTRF